MRTIGLMALAALASATPLSARETAPPHEAKAWALPDRELMVPVEGGRVWVSINGDLEAKAPPVILIHGGPGGTHTGMGAMTALADERAVILYDQLDSGMSDRPNDPSNWRVERFVAELEAIRVALGIEKWHLAGFSWGSALALEYAAAYPERTVSTVIGNTFISTPHWIFGTRLLVKDLPDQVQRDIAACQSPAPPSEAVCKAADAAFSAAYNGRPDRPERSPAAVAYRERTNGKGFNETLYNAMWGPTEFTATGTLKTYEATHLLSKIDGSRTQFLIGQYDEAQLDIVRGFVRLTPGAELAVVPGGSHSAMGERPVETEGLLRGWLRRKDPR